MLSRRLRKRSVALRLDRRRLWRSHFGNHLVSLVLPSSFLRRLRRRAPLLVGRCGGDRGPRRRSTGDCKSTARFLATAAIALFQAFLPLLRAIFSPWGLIPNPAEEFPKPHAAWGHQWWLVRSLMASVCSSSRSQPSTRASSSSSIL
jgi:hypothetical protein